MREVKFRYIFKHNASGNIEVKHYHLNQLEERTTKELSPCFWADYTLLSRDQYTGSSDKGGVEIYEGDILKITSEYEPEDCFNITKVKFEDGGFIIDVSGFAEYDITTVGWALHEECELEVIGNIYEHPELLERSNVR